MEAGTSISYGRGRGAEREPGGVCVVGRRPATLTLVAAAAATVLAVAGLAAGLATDVGVSHRSVGLVDTRAPRTTAPAAAAETPAALDLQTIEERLASIESSLGRDPAAVPVLRSDVEHLAATVDRTRDELNRDIDFTRTLTLASVLAIAIGMLQQGLQRRKDAPPPPTSPAP
jgi:hypothetical protein